MPMKGDWQKIINEKVTESIDRIAKNGTTKIVEYWRDEILREIESGEFDTVGGATAIGLKDKGKYKRSIKLSQRKKVGNTYTQSVGSTDPKAVPLEYGTEPEDHVDLEKRTLIAWAKRKGINNYVEGGSRVWASIKKNGTVPKPAFRRAMMNTKTRKGHLKFKIIRNTKL